MPVKKQSLLLWAVLLVLLGLLKLLFPGRTEELRLRAEEIFCPGSVEAVEAWGRAFAGEEERIAVLAPGEEP